MQGVPILVGMTHSFTMEDVLYLHTLLSAMTSSSMIIYHGKRLNRFFNVSTRKSWNMKELCCQAFLRTNFLTS